MFNFGSDAGIWDMSRVERNAHIYEENDRYTSGAVRRFIGRLIGGIGVLLMVLIITASLGLVIPRILGYDSYVVVSGSMEPAITVGSIVYSHAVDPADIEAGDVIVFVDPVRGETPITHRVVSNDVARCELVTKGDANAGTDIDPVRYENVLGRVSMHIPYVGYPASVFATYEGKIAAAMAIIAAWLLTEVGSRLTGQKKQRRKA